MVYSFTEWNFIRIGGLVYGFHNNTERFVWHTNHSLEDIIAHITYIKCGLFWIALVRGKRSTSTCLSYREKYRLTTCCGRRWAATTGVLYVNRPVWILVCPSPLWKSPQSVCTRLGNDEQDHEIHRLVERPYVENRDHAANSSLLIHEWSARSTPRQRLFETIRHLRTANRSMIQY